MVIESGLSYKEIRPGPYLKCDTCYHGLVREVLSRRDVVFVADVGDVITRTLRPDSRGRRRHPDDGVVVGHLRQLDRVRVLLDLQG